ncbi:MAG TPA: hypothetical protein VGD54_15650, partial [Steroidobacteraceae bacterium]
MAKDPKTVVAAFLRYSRFAYGAALLACLCLPRFVAAEISAVPDASIKYEYNSNIFAVPAGDALLVSQGDLT